MKKWIVSVLCLMMLGVGTGGVLPAAVRAEIAEPEYKIQGVDNNSGDYIIAKWNVKDLGAKGDGVTDDTAAFTQAIQKTNAEKGGVIYVPPGKYVIKEKLVLNYRVSLEGHWNDPQLQSSGEESILYADIPSGEDSVFINVGLSCSIRNISVYYPNQKADAVVPYGYTINATGHSQTIENVTFLNSYRGINVGNKDAGSAHFVNNIHGTILNQGIRFNEDFEVTSLTNVYFSPSYWVNYDGADGGKIAAAAKECLPVYVGKVDDQFLYNINVAEYEKSVRVEKNPNHTDPNTPAMGYGLFFRMNGSPMDIPDDDKYLPKRYKLDTIEGLDYYEHIFAADRFSTKSQLFNVTSYGAIGDGVTDDTAAFRSALSAAGDNGGGVVFAPIGKYKLTSELTVPENVELRGEWNGTYMKSPSEIFMSFGKNQEDKALITLSKNSGIHGFTFRIPEAKWDDIQPYAWAVRGAGSDVWTEYLTFINLYRGIDFHTNACNDSLIKGTWGTAADTGIAVGGGTVNAKLEFNFFTFGTWFEDIGRVDNGTLATYTYNHMKGFVFGDVKNVEGFSLCIFGVQYGLRFEKQGNGQPENVQIIRSLLDSPRAYRNLYLGAGNNLAFVGVSTGNSTPTGRLIYTDKNFDGKARVYGQNMWGSAFNYLKSGDVKVYAENEQNAEILKFDFHFAHDRLERNHRDSSKDGLPVYAVVLIVAGCVVVAAGAAVAVILILTRKKKNAPINASETEQETQEDDEKTE